MQPREPITAGWYIRDGLRSLFRPPYRTLFLLSVVVSLTSANIGGDVADQTALVLSLALFAVSVYLQIAVTLAAGRFEADTSADFWIKAAWRRRVFWRYLFASLLAVAALLFGVVIFVVGLFVAGAVVALYGPAVALERQSPVAAVFRSAQLTKGSRWAVGTVFAVLFVLPNIGVQAAFLAELHETVGPVWIAITVGAEMLGLAGVIALTKMFVDLGGAPTPPPQQIEPPPVEVPR